MLLRIPDYYDSFLCIGDKCPDNCCIGWELDIDDDTYEYYRSVPGPFGDRLRANMSHAKESGTDDEIKSFHLQVNGRCPFLNESNLCDICLKLGPDALCRICTDYPRYSFEWGNAVEKSLTLSCPEAGRLHFLNDIPLSFKEIPLSGTGLDAYMDREIYEEMGAGDHEAADSHPDGSIQENADTENNTDILWENSANESCGDAPAYDYADEEDSAQIEKVYQLRSACIRILQDRTLSVDERVSRFLRYCETPDYSMTFRTRLDILSGMEILNDRWTAVMRELEAFASDETSYEAALDSFLSSEDYKKYEYTYEHLLVYYTFRYFPRAAYDYDPANKARFAVFCYQVIRDMDALRFMKTGTFTFEDRIETVKDFSKQVEHSDYNIDCLMEELLFSD